MIKDASINNRILHTSCLRKSLLLKRSSQQGLLLVPFARTSTKQIRAFSVVGPARQPGTASLLNFAFLTEPLQLRFFLTLRLLCLTVLVLGALLSSFLEEALYKCSI